jgi:hypothetical protein
VKKEQKVLKNEAFDLLDALSRSGSLDIQEASLHVLVATTHCFAETLMNTLLKDNINPIEKVCLLSCLPLLERTLLKYSRLSGRS